MSQSVLVFDDEPKLVALVKGYLEASNFRVIQAFNGKDALLAIKAEVPDCVILDINMPDMDGLAHEGYDRTIDDSETPRYLKTVRSVGYRFMEQDDET